MSVDSLVGALALTLDDADLLDILANVSHELQSEQGTNVACDLLEQLYQRHSCDAKAYLAASI